NKLYDYYAVGRPVIAAVGGDVNEEVTEFGIGVAVPPGRSEELASRIAFLASLPSSERHNMGCRARRLAETTYERRKIAEKFRELVEADSPMVGPLQSKSG